MSTENFRNINNNMRLQQYIKEQAKIEFYDESIGYQSGQTDMRLNAKINGKTVGYLDYTIYNDEVSVKYIQGSKQHKGIGKALALKLQALFPKTEIEWGMLTGHGSRLMKSIKSKLYVDRKRLNHIKALKKEYAKLKKLERDTEKSGDWSNWDNDVYDRQYEIEQELHDLGVHDL